MTMTNYEELLHRTRDILYKHIKTELKKDNILYTYFFDTTTINWVNIKKDSVTLQFVINRSISSHCPAIDILNDLFLRLFGRKLSESKNYDKSMPYFIVYSRLTLTYEELSYVYTYLSLKYR